MEERPFTIFVVEDDEWYNKLLVHELSLDPEFLVKSFTSGRALLDALSESPDVITLDYRLPDLNGEELLKKIKAFDPSIEVLIISEQEDVGTAVGLLKAGAFDYIVKSKDIRGRLLNTIHHIQKASGLEKEVKTLRKQVQGKYQMANMVVGESPAIQKVLEMMNKAIGTNLTVTITGETGTGKELVAKAIHFNSKRKDRPFVPVNMAAIPADLIESELFGHEKGAFTGAAARRKGKFEEADGGTLFLDEIGEMDIAFQAKLLRAVQEKEVTRLGSNTPVKTDCRIIVATNRDLAQAVKNGTFREDLYYRFFGIPIHLPPLRERGKDLLLLADHFISNFCQEEGMSPKPLEQDAKTKLLGYNWPGNVRELRSVIELSLIMASGDSITASDIMLSANDALPDVLDKDSTMRQYQQRIVQQYMQHYNNDTALVAQKLDIGQTTVYRLLKEIEEHKT